MLSRAKPAVGGAPPQGDKRKKKGKKRDFTGAIALLEFKRHVGEQDEDTGLWIGYCAFHLGDYKRALEDYINMIVTQVFTWARCYEKFCCSHLDKSRAVTHVPLISPKACWVTLIPTHC
uniref:Intraflagellar transport protein 56 n=1 Tax=Chrysemys picta bellii TaxID=8478 RepID=A0A8C3I9Z2_CHRPI